MVLVCYPLIGIHPSSMYTMRTHTLHHYVCVCVWKGEVRDTLPSTPVGWYPAAVGCASLRCNTTSCYITTLHVVGDEMM